MGAVVGLDWIKGGPAQSRKRNELDDVVVVTPRAAEPLLVEAGRHGIVGDGIEGNGIVESGVGGRGWVLVGAGVRTDARGLLIVPLPEGLEPWRRGEA
jgi:hypothetical protein